MRALSRRRSGLVIAGIAASLVLAACSSTKTTTSNGGGGGGDTTGASGSSAPANSQVSNAIVTPPTTCGEDLKYTQPDPDKIISGLPASVQQAVSTYPYVVRGTPWSTFKGKKGPWKLGYISVPVNNPWQVNLTAQLKSEFAAAKAQGLVTGSLNIYIQPSSSTATPEQQSAAIAQMVRQGVDGIFLFPADSVAETPAIDAAGKAGVPVVTMSPAPNSQYAINVTSNNQSASYAGFLKIMAQQGVIKQGKTVNVLVVRGVPGVTVEQTYNDMMTADLKPCPGIKIVGTVWGQWNPATTKTQVLNFLAAHPGKIDIVMQQGSMQGGVIEAFQQAGRAVPPMPFGGTAGGDLAWWAQNKATYQTVGAEYGGTQVGYTTFNIMTRILAGKGPRLRDFEIPPENVTNANIDDFATPGTNLTWIGDPRGPKDGWINNTQLDNYFTTPGAAIKD